MFDHLFLFKLIVYIVQSHAMHMIVSHEVTGKNNPCCTRVLQAITEGKTQIFSQVFSFIFKQSMLLTFNTFKVRGTFFFFFICRSMCV